MANQLPSGRWRGRVRDPRTGKQVAPHTVIGGPSTYATQRDAERAEDDARDVLHEHALRGETVGEFWREWTTDPLWARPAESTNLHNAERTRAFADALRRPAVALDRRARRRRVAQGRPQPRHRRRAARDVQRRAPPAGGHADRRATRSRARAQALARAASTSSRPRPGEVARLIARRRRADAAELRRVPARPPCYYGDAPGRARRAALGRPRLHARRRDDPHRAPVERQGAARSRRPSTARAARSRWSSRVRDRLLALPRESEWVFTTLRGTHYTPSTRIHHWNRVRCAVGLGNDVAVRGDPPLLRVVPAQRARAARPRRRAAASATTTAARSCASSTGTRTPRSRASASARRSATVARSSRAAEREGGMKRRRRGSRFARRSGPIAAVVDFG